MIEAAHREAQPIAHAVKIVVRAGKIVAHQSPPPPPPSPPPQPPSLLSQLEEELPPESPLPLLSRLSRVDLRRLAQKMEAIHSSAMASRIRIRYFIRLAVCAGSSSRFRTARRDRLTPRICRFFGWGR